MSKEIFEGEVIDAKETTPKEMMKTRTLDFLDETSPVFKKHAGAAAEDLIGWAVDKVLYILKNKISA